MSLWSWLSTPTCPVGPREKAWVETNYRTIAASLHLDRSPRRRVITPSDEFFPDAFDGSEESTQQLADRVCQYLEMDPRSVAWQASHEGCQHGEARGDHESCQHGGGQPKHQGCGCGPHQEPLHPAEIVVAVARAVARQRLQDQELPADLLEQQWMVDLTAIALGMGVFVANGAGMLADKPIAHRPVNLPARIAGYALALHTWLIGESKLSWATYLKRDVADSFHSGLRYLEKTGESIVGPDNLYRDEADHSNSATKSRLQRDAELIAAIWKLARLGTGAAEAVSAVNHCLTHERPAIRAEAARAIAVMGAAAEPAIDHLVQALHSPVREVSATATYALGCLHQRPECVVPELLLAMDTNEDLETAAWSLAQFGPAATSALPKLLGWLEAGLHRNEFVDYLAFAVRAISDNADEQFRQLLDGFDPEIRPQVDSLLPAPGPIGLPPGGRPWQHWIDGPS